VTPIYSLPSTATWPNPSYAVRFSASGSLVVDTARQSDLVWHATAALGRVEAPRLDRDELRVALAADAVGTYDAEAAATIDRAECVPPASSRDTSTGRTGRHLPPQGPVSILGRARLGAESGSFSSRIGVVARIANGIPRCRIVRVGAQKSGAGSRNNPVGVRDLGSSTICTNSGYVQGHDRADQDRRRGAREDTGRRRIDCVVGTSAAVGSLSQVFTCLPSTTTKP